MVSNSNKARIVYLSVKSMVGGCLLKFKVSRLVCGRLRWKRRDHVIRRGPITDRQGIEAGLYQLCNLPVFYD